MARRSRFALFLVSLLGFTLLPAYGAAAAPKKPAKPAAKPAAKPKKPTGPYFRLDKVTSTFSHFCGFRAAGDKTGEVKTLLVFSDVPVDCAAADAEFDPEGAIEVQIDGLKGAYVELHLDPDGKHANGNWKSNEPNDGFSFGGQGELVFARRDEARVEGRYRTLTPESFFQQTFEFDLPFAVDLLAGSMAGTPLPKGGGDPGKAYLAYLKAVDKKDPAGLQKYSSAARASEIKQQIADEIFEGMFDSARTQELKTAAVTGGLIRGNRAKIDVSGVNYDGDKVGGQIFLLQENGTWKVDSKAIGIRFD
ncbi:MAG: hypothetical protein ABJC13_06640 [Acidobacteriota bacterium]